MPGTNAIGKPIWPIATTAAVVGLLFVFTSAHAAEQGAAVVQQKGAVSTTKPSVVAWVDSSPIYYSDVERAIVGVRGKKIDPDKLPQIQAAALADLIQQKVLSKFLESAELQPTTAEVDAAMADFKKRLEDQKLTLNQFFEQTKKTEASLRKQLGMDIALQKYIAKNTTDDNLQQYFHDHRPDFDGTERRVSHILIRPLGVTNEESMKAILSQAKQLRGQIVVGDITFEAAAKRYSDGPSRYHGGDLGFISRQGVVSLQFAESAFALRPGDVSQPVVDSFGVHLIKATDSKPGQKTWEDAREELKVACGRTVFNKLISDLHQKAKIEIFESFPHFTPGTHELAAPQPVGIAP